MNKLKKAGTWVLPAALTAIAIVWAVVAIGGTLTAIAHPVFAYAAAVLYDSVWLFGLAMETAHRRQGSNARLPRVIGWLFLPLTVAVLAVHGVLAGDLLAAAVGALVPVLAKVTLLMAIDRDATRISPRAQSAIDRARAVTRDRIAVSRAMAEARAHNTKVAAELLKRWRKAEAEAVTTVRQSESYAEIVGQGAELPGLISDREMEDLLSGDQARRSTAPRATHHRDSLTVREKEALRNARKQRKALVAGHDDVFVEVVPGLGRLAPADTPTTSHAPIVYFLRNGNRLKIGTSTNLRERVGSLSLRMRDVILIVEGGRDVERAFHQHFAGQRVKNTEWFAFSGAVNRWVRAARHRLSVTEWQPPADAAQEDTLAPVIEFEIDRPEVPPVTALEVTGADPTPPLPELTAGSATPLVICGDRRVWHPEFPSRGGDDEVSGAMGDRLPTEAAANVIRAAWVMGTSVTETARQATRSTSYVKKVFARLEEERTKDLPEREWPPLKWGETA